MSGADFILAINLSVAGLLAAAFAAISLYDREPAPRWLTISYLTGMAYLVVEFSIPAFSDARLPVTVSFGVLLLATMLFNVGLARRYGVTVPWLQMTVFMAAAIVLVYAAQDLQRQSLSRMMAYQLPYSVMQLIGMAIVLSSKRRREWPDVILIALLAASAAQFASKPFMALALGGWGSAPQSYLQTTYAMASQSLGTVFAMAIALMLLAILVRDALSEATSRSETDSLSGLLNRGGFERNAEAALRKVRRQGMPISLVIADLDHFKQINDSFGHAGGDRVIQVFAGFLREAAAGHHIAGRVGGEEFAILLPGVNLIAARLFAEGARAAFAAIHNDRLPQGGQITASFGVAEAMAGETLPDLMRHADEALYSAKKNGRNQVCVFTPPLVLIPGELRSAG
jgi:diguanylate cyclase (GGDEF)-like protein